MMIGTILFSMISVASAAFGPMSLYNTIEGNTLTFGDYVVKPYFSVSYGNISYGSFNTYVAENDVYTYQYYTSGNSAGCASPRSMKLFIACGTTTSLGPVSEPVPCVYQSVMEVPQACGVSFVVGNEMASPVPTPSNATVIGGSSSADGMIGMILGALGVSGIGVIIIMQIVKAIRNKGGLGQLFKSNAGKIDALMNKVPVPDSVKKSIKTIAEKQIEKVDNELDKRLHTTRTKIAELEGRKYAEDTPVSKPVKKPVVDLDDEPVAKKQQIELPEIKEEPVKKAVEHVKVVEHVESKPTHEEEVIPVQEVHTAKLEISLADLDEIKALLQRRNKQFAVAE